jgi:hypothetical protein
MHNEIFQLNHEKPLKMKTLKGTSFNKHSHQDNRGLRSLDAKLIYLFGDATTIAQLGRFLSECAEEMQGKKPFHRHFRDFQRGWDMNMLDVVVERPVSKAKRAISPD